MNDQELKKLFKAMNHGEPSQMEVARWKKAVRAAVRLQTPSEWARLAVACLIGMVIGATAFHDKAGKTEKTENFAEDATIERVHVNL